MTIVLTGGGSGGHITPLLVVASELKRQNPELKLIYIGQKGDAFADIPAEDKNINKVYKVRAGKFRRYHGEGLKQYLNVFEIAKNIRDVFYVLIGIIQSYILVKRIKPKVVFSRGGYVSVPVCLGAKYNGVPYITHDSDPVPSLTNRLIGPAAKYNLVSQSPDIYPYKKEKTISTGVPISKSYVPVTEEQRSKYRQKLNISPKSKVLFVIGGGLGAKSLSEALNEILPNLLSEFEDLIVIHQTGIKNEEQTVNANKASLDSDQLDRVEVLPFTDKVYMYSAAADVVVTRAGATNLAEFEAQGAACIVVPSTVLVGGHQLKNAEILKERKAAIVINDAKLAEDPNLLAKEISLLLKDPNMRKMLGQELLKFAHPNATEKIAKIIIDTAEAK